MTAGVELLRVHQIPGLIFLFTNLDRDVPFSRSRTEPEV